MARWRQFGIGAAAVLVVGLAVGIPTVARSDIAHVDFRPADGKPGPVQSQPIPTSARSLWSAPGLSTVVSPVTASTVVTAGGHEISGRDPVRGTTRWHYRRTNADLCGWTLAGTKAIAVYRNGHSCSDITGFDADTGRRQWYLNADLPASITMLPGPSLWYAVSTAHVSGYYLDGGTHAWTFARRGCTLGGVASGDVGLLAITRCGGESTLVCLDGFTGKQRWQVGLAGTGSRLLGADRAVLVESRVAGRLQVAVYGSDGKPTGSLASPALSPPTPAAVTPAVSVVDTTILTFDGHRVLAVDTRADKLVWSAPALGPAAVTGQVAYVPRPGGFTGYDTRTGRAVGTVAVPDFTAPVKATAQFAGRLVAVTAARTRVVG